jgi:hypothetical protein
MRKTRLGVVSMLLAGASACTPTTATPPTPTTPVAVPTPTATATASAGPDLSPVAEPADIVGIARWRNPMATVSNLASCAGVAPVIVEVNARMMVDQTLRQVIRGSLDTRKLAGLIALDAPVDVVVALDPQSRPRPPLVGVAVGLTSLDGAKVAIAADGQPPELAPGVWRVKAERGAACAVAASVGTTPGRLVCAEKEKTLTALAPYLARTAPAVDLGGPDLHVEARLGVLRKRYGEAFQRTLRSAPGAIQAEYGVGNERFDRLLFESATAVQEDVWNLLEDTQTVTAEVRTERSGTCLRATADIDLSSKTSWLASTLTDRLERSGPPPAIYWRQPKDSEIAVYSRGVDPARFTGVLPKVRDLLDAALAAEGLAAPADRKKITELVDMPHGKDTTMVWSHGSVNVPIPQVDPASKGGAQKLADAALARVLGWTLIGVDEGPAAMKKQLKALVDAYKLKSVQALLKKELGPTDSKMTPTLKSVPAPAGLGAGSEALEITIPGVEVPLQDTGSAKAPTITLKLHLLLMPDGDSTWLAIGAAKDELVKRLSAVKSSAADKDQLATRAGLDPLRNGQQMFGGFLSAAPAGQKIAAVIQAAGALEPALVSSYETGLSQALVNLPNRGQTPIFLTTNGTPGATTKLHLALDVQKGTFEDAKSLAVGAYSFFSRMGLLP